MTTAELLADFSSKFFVGMLIGDAEDTGLAVPVGVKLKKYRQNYLEIYSIGAWQRAFHFYVVDEGEATEAAYYADNEPKQTVNVSHPLAVQYKDTIDSKFGKVIEAGEDYIKIQGLANIDANTVEVKTWILRDNAGTPDVREIV